MPRCAIFGCGRPTQAREGKGLSATHCRYHVQWKNRHGSYWKGTYSAAELRPYRLAADRYLRAHAADFWIAAALNGLRATLDGAGPNERVVDVLRMSPARKARAALARMRTNGVPAERLLRIYFAVSACVVEDVIQPGLDGDEYRLTQIGKAAMRTASGYHSVYGQNSRYDRYPRSGGQALRIIGRTIDDVCMLAAVHHKAAFLAFKVKGYGPRARVPLGKIA